MAQEKKAEKKQAQRTMKILVDNDKVRASESVWKAGESNPMEDRPYRVMRVISGTSTVERTHADGKKETIKVKPGDFFAWGPDKVSMKNVGKADVVTYTVTPKSK